MIRCMWWIVLYTPRGNTRSIHDRGQSNVWGWKFWCQVFLGGVKFQANVFFWVCNMKLRQNPTPLCILWVPPWVYTLWTTGLWDVLYLITNEELSDGHVVSFKPSCSHWHDYSNQPIYFLVSNLISQETGTLSIGRYSGELKKGQIFSGGN